MYPGIHVQILPPEKVLPKISPLQVWPKFLGMEIGRKVFEGERSTAYEKKSAINR
jgi:hypothetical protein